MKKEIWILGEQNSGERELPEGTENIELRLPFAPCILNITEARGYCGFWYELSLRSEGYRLGHNLFLMENEAQTLTGEDFRYQTKRVSLRYESIPLSRESAEKLAHDMKRLFSDREELDRKWKYQIQVYDEKVQETLRLERDKVELNEAIEELRGETAFWRGKYHEMEQSLSWRLTAPVRSLHASYRRFKEKSPIQKEKKAYLAFLAEQEKEERKEGLKVSLLIDIRTLSETEIFPLIYRLKKQTFQNMELVLLGGGKLAAWLSEHDERVKAAGEEGFSALVRSATGDYLGILDVTDTLEENALSLCAEKLLETGADALYTDSDCFGSGVTGETRSYKPDFSPDYLRSCNYIRGLFLARRELFEKIDYEKEEIGGRAHYGLILRITELAEKGKGIAHLPEILYHERVEALPGVLLEAEKDASLWALQQHLIRTHLSGMPEVIDKKRGLFHIRYELLKEPLISILIPNKDHVEDLKRCIDSVLRLSTYRNLEIVVVENNSAKKETFDFYRELENHYAERFSRIITEDGGRTLSDTEAENIEIRVVTWKEGFNFSAINNFGVPETKGEYLLLLNNDIEVITPGWIEEMLMLSQRSDVGAVGAKLYYKDDTVQHAGVIIGLGGVAAHSHLQFPREAEGYMGRLKVVQNLSAVTAACLLMRRSVYDEIGGMNPGYEVAFNDADFCMRIRSKGYLIAFTPFAELYHDESKSRGVEDTPEKAERFESEVQRFKAEWPEILQNGDPYYNPHLTTDKEDFSIK